MGASNILSGRVIALSADPAQRASTQTIQIETESGLRVISRGGQDMSSGTAVDFYFDRRSVS